MNITYETHAAIRDFLYEELEYHPAYRLSPEEANALAQFIVNWEESTWKPLSFGSAYDIRIQSSVTAWQDWVNDNESLVQETMEDQDLNREEAIDYMKENFSDFEQGELIDGYVVAWQ